MKRKILSMAALAGILGAAACGGGDEASAGGDSGFEAMDDGQDTVTTPLPEAGAAGRPGAPGMATSVDTAGSDTMRR